MTEDTTTADTQTKATLFCHDCGHESRYDGDWRRVERADSVQYLCPDCHTVITARPATDTGPETPFGLWRAWVDSVPRVARRATRLATAPLLVAMLTRYTHTSDCDCRDRDPRHE